MAQAPRLRLSCPQCGRTIFNRRNGVCEFCSAVLPQESLYSAQQLASIEDDHQRNEVVRKRLALEAEELERNKAKRRGDGGRLLSGANSLLRRP